MTARIAIRSRGHLRPAFPDPIVKQPGACAIILAAGNRREFRLDFPWPALQERGFVCSLIKRERSAARRVCLHLTLFAKERALPVLSTGSPCGAPAAAFDEPWCPTPCWSRWLLAGIGQVRDINPRPRSGPGGCPPGPPGITIASRDRRRRSPSTFKIASRTPLRRTGILSKIYQW